MAQAPLREHYDSDEDYFRELDIYNTQVSSDLDSISDALGITVSRDAQDRPVIDGIVQPYEERYLHTRYGTDENGAGFTADYTTISGLTVFQGIRNSDVPAESTNPAEYTWREITVSSGWAPYFRTLGGRQIDWVFTTTVPTGYTLDDSGTVVDLDSLPGAIGAPGQSAIQALVSYSNGRVIVRAPNNGDYTPAPVDSVITTRVDVIFQSTEGGTVFARLSKNVSYDITTNIFSQVAINHPSGDLNVASVTVSPTITANGVELSFAYDANNRQANTEAEVFLVQGGGVGPANLRRFRTASSAGIAGRPTTDSGLDNNWVDNPDFLNAGTLFESTQQVNITQDGSPYSTDLVFSGTGGGSTLPAQPEIQTITVGTNAQTSSFTVGSPETTTFNISGSPGNFSPNTVNISFPNLPATLLYDSTQEDGGASLTLIGDILRQDSQGLTISTLGIRNDDNGTDNLTAYANTNGLATGTTINTLDFLNWIALGIAALSVQATASLISGNATLTLTDIRPDLTHSWTAVSGFDGDRFSIYRADGVDTFPSGADGASSLEHYRSAVNTVTSTAIYGSTAVAQIPYIDNDGNQQSFTSPSIIFQPSDNTSSLLADRFVDGIAPELKFTLFYENDNSQRSWDFGSGVVITDWADAGNIRVSLGSAFLLAPDMPRFYNRVTIETFSGTATFSFTVTDPLNTSTTSLQTLNLGALISSTGSPPGSFPEGSLFTFFTSKQTFLDFFGEVGVTADNGVISINNFFQGNVTNSLVLTTTQNTGNVLYSSPTITDGTVTEDTSDITLRFENNAGTNEDLTIMFNSQLDADGIAAAIGSNITQPVETTVFTSLYDILDDVFTSDRWNFRDSTEVLSNVLTPTNWPSSGIIRVNIDAPSPLYDSTTVIVGSTLTIDDSNGNSAVYSVSEVSTVFGINVDFILATLESSTGVVPPTNTLTTLTLMRPIPTAIGFSSSVSGNVVTITSEENEPRSQTTVVNADAGTNGNITSDSFTIATVQDGVVPFSIIIGTVSQLTITTSSGTTSLSFLPGIDSTTMASTVAVEFGGDTLEMYASSSSSTVDLESYSRALGADFTFTATFNPGDSSTASMVQENEVSGTNEVHDGTQVRWSRAIQVGTIS